MLFHRADSLLKGEFTLESYLKIADALCHNQLEVSPVFECIKVFARVNEEGNFVYARHKFDLGNSNVNKFEISSRIKDEKRSAAVCEALEEVEDRLGEVWPFSPGSATWVLLEILHPEIRLASFGNRPTVVFRTANRISSKGVLSETALTKSLFSRFESALQESTGSFAFSFNPTVRLQNISGSGIYTRFREEHDGVTFLCGDDKKKLSQLPSGLKEHYIDSFFEMVSGLLERNFDIKESHNPGFLFILNEQLFKVQGREFEKQRSALSQEKASKQYSTPLPFGYRK